MEQYEYASLTAYQAATGNALYAYVLKTQQAEVLLDGTSTLDAFNEIGRLGWVVFEKVFGSLNLIWSAEVKQEYERRVGWTSDQGWAVTLWWLRRSLE